MTITEIEQTLGWRDQSSNPQGKFQTTSTQENSQGCLHANILRRIPALIHPEPVTYISQSIKKNLSASLALSYLNLPARSSTFRDSCSRIQVPDLSSCPQRGVALPSFSIQPPLDSGKPASNLQDDTLANSDGDDLVKIHHPKTLVITETKANGSDVPRIINKMPFNAWEDTTVIDNKGGMWIMWNSNRITVDIIFNTEQEIHATVKVLSSNTCCEAISVHDKRGGLQVNSNRSLFYLSNLRDGTNLIQERFDLALANPQMESLVLILITAIFSSFLKCLIPILDKNPAGMVQPSGLYKSYP
ncbi:hypothetical protein GOBAR_DD10843 [Gossypium barbadense]|nr:hypothetical protein GOBAR_DD10843 [Gossypium barbadense]